MRPFPQPPTLSAIACFPLYISIVWCWFCGAVLAPLLVFVVTFFPLDPFAPHHGVCVNFFYKRADFVVMVVGMGLGGVCVYVLFVFISEVLIVARCWCTRRSSQRFVFVAFPNFSPPFMLATRWSSLFCMFSSVSSSCLLLHRCSSLFSQLCWENTVFACLHVLLHISFFLLESCVCVCSFVTRSVHVLGFLLLLLSRSLFPHSSPPKHTFCCSHSFLDLFARS